MSVCLRVCVHSVCAVVSPADSLPRLPSSSPTPLVLLCHLLHVTCCLITAGMAVSLPELRLLLNTSGNGLTLLRVALSWV